MENITGFPVVRHDYLSSRLYLVEELREIISEKIYHN